MNHEGSSPVVQDFGHQNPAPMVRWVRVRHSGQVLVLDGTLAFGLDWDAMSRPVRHSRAPSQLRMAAVRLAVRELLTWHQGKVAVSMAP